MGEPNNGDPVAPYMDIYKERKILMEVDKLKLKILVRGDLQNKGVIGDTWYPTASMRNLKNWLTYFSVLRKSQCQILYNTDMHQMGLNWLYYTMMIIVFIGIHLRN